MAFKKFDTINVVPFIDVMLVLLTIVLTLATFVAKGLIPIDLPQGQHADSTQHKNIEITINAHGELFYNDIPLSSTQLHDKLTLLTPQDTLVIRSDKKANMESFVTVMDTAKELGLSKIAIETLK